MSETIVAAPPFSVTARAAARVAEIARSQQGAQPGSQADAALRVSVLAGGCSGFQYKFELDETQQDDDLVIKAGPARVVVDPVSMDLLAGSQLDYADELMGAYFKIQNPNATSSCGCGTSFSID